MKDTFIVYEISPKTTTRFEIPTSLQWIFDEWRDHKFMLTILGPTGRRKSMSVQKRLDLLRDECPPELFNQIKVIRKPTVLKVKGFEGTVTHFDYPI